MSQARQLAFQRILSSKQSFASVCHENLAISQSASGLPSAPPRARRARRGSVLVEFALIALVAYVVLAAAIEFGA